MFSVNSLNSVTNKLSLQQNDSNSSNLLCERPACYHSASTTHVRDRIFKFSSIHASVIYLIPWIQWKFLSFRKNSNKSVLVSSNKGFVCLFLENFSKSMLLFFVPTPSLPVGLARPDVKNFEIVCCTQWKHWPDGRDHSGWYPAWNNIFTLLNAHLNSGGLFVAKCLVKK